MLRHEENEYLKGRRRIRSFLLSGKKAARTERLRNLPGNNNEAWMQ